MAASERRPISIFCEISSELTLSVKNVQVHRVRLRVADRWATNLLDRDRLEVDTKRDGEVLDRFMLLAARKASVIVQSSPRKRTEHVRLEDILASLDVVVTVLDLEEENYLVIADELDPWSTEGGEEAQVEPGGLVAVVFARSVVLEETSTVLDDAGGGLESSTVLTDAATSVLVERQELAVDVVRGGLSAVSNAHVVELLLFYQRGTLSARC